MHSSVWPARLQTPQERGKRTAGLGGPETVLKWRIVDSLALSAGACVHLIGGLLRGIRVGIALRRRRVGGVQARHTGGLRRSVSRLPGGRRRSQTVRRSIG